MRFLKIGRVFINPAQITHVEEWQRDGFTERGELATEMILSVYLASTENVRFRGYGSDGRTSRQEQLEFRFRGADRLAVRDWLFDQEIIEINDNPPRSVSDRQERAPMGFWLEEWSTTSDDRPPAAEKHAGDTPGSL